MSEHLEPTLTHCRVLLVDDEETILVPLADSLRDAGATVVTASSGHAAVEILAGQTFDVVVSDVRMPGLSGLDLLTRIKQSVPSPEVILVTAYANVEHAVEILEDYTTINCKDIVPGFSVYHGRWER